MKTYPKIPSFRQVVRTVRAEHDYAGKDADGKPVYEHSNPYPTGLFVGTVKIHGTNASVQFEDNLPVVYYRSSQLNEHNDNYGFYAYIASLPADVLGLLDKYDAVFGEWCGKGINKGCGIHQLERRWILFDARQDGMWVQIDFGKDSCDTLNKHGIYVINLNFPVYTIDVDFNAPEIAAGKMAELVNKVEIECPVSKSFGVDGTGEGIVWHNAHDLSSKYWFKTKGTKHITTKTKTVVPVDVEKLKDVKAFVDATVTKARLEQGLAVMAEQNAPLAPESTGLFLKWVVNDILTEEADTMKENVLKKSDVTRALSSAARQFWFQTIAHAPL